MYKAVYSDNLQRWTVVDAKGKLVIAFLHQAHAEHFAAAMNMGMEQIGLGRE